MLEGILEGQMAPQYFPVQTLKNMGATIEIAAVAEGTPFTVEGCRVRGAHQPARPHGRAGVPHRGGRARPWSTPPTPATRRAGARRAVDRSLPRRRRADPRQHLHARGSRALPASAGSRRSRTPWRCAARAGVKKLVAVPLRSGLQRRRRRRSVRARAPLLDAQGATDIELAGAAEGDDPDAVRTGAAMVGARRLRDVS